MARVVFLGTPEIAAVTLRGLCEASELEVVGVITQADRPAGRGLRLHSSPVKKLALELGIRMLQPIRVRGSQEAIDFLNLTRPDVMVVVAFGQILPQEFFAGSQWGTLNLHTSLLPCYRGAAPVVRAIEQGEVVTGVSIMRIDAGMDSGDVLSQEEVVVGPDETAGELEGRLAEIGCELLLRTLPSYLDGTITPWSQDDSLVTFAPMVRREEGCIDWSQPAPAIHNRIRAFNPRPGAFSHRGGEMIKIWRTRNPGSPREPAPPGTILELDSRTLQVACGDRSQLEIVEIQPANRRRMNVADFANGHFAAKGELLG